MTIRKYCERNVPFCGGRDGFLNGMQFTGVFLKNRVLTGGRTGIYRGRMRTEDAPEIRRMERFGALREAEEPVCPVCGAECEWIYVYRGRDPAGCDRCVQRRDAWKEGEAWNRNR